MSKFYEILEKKVIEKYPGFYLELKNEYLKSIIESKGNRGPIKKHSNTIDWAVVFGKDKQLTTKMIKARVFSIYSIPERTCEKIMARDLDEFRIQIGLYKSPVELCTTKEES